MSRDFVSHPNDISSSNHFLHDDVLNRANTIGQETLPFLDDNDRPHLARIVKDASREEEIHHLALPLLSHDLNAIEHVWGILLVLVQLDNYHLNQPLFNSLHLYCQFFDTKYILTTALQIGITYVDAHGGATTY